jgi:hypothetical protein
MKLEHGKDDIDDDDGRKMTKIKRKKVKMKTKQTTY